MSCHSLNSHHAFFVSHGIVTASFSYICLSPNSRTIYVGWTESLFSLQGLVLSHMRAPTIYESDDLSLTIHTVSLTPAPMYGLLTTTLSGTEPNYHHSVRAVTFIFVSAIRIISLVHISAGSYISTLHPHAWISSIQKSLDGVIDIENIETGICSMNSGLINRLHWKQIIYSIYSCLPPIPVQRRVLMLALCYVQHFWDIVLCFLVRSVPKCKIIPRAGR